MIKKIHILFVLVFLMGVSGFAQEKLITKANEKYDEYSFSPAIDIYKKVLDRGYVSADLLKKLGNSYYYNADYEDAANTYKRLVDEYPDETGPEYYFRYAQTLKTLEDYETSKVIMAKFLEVTSDDVRANTYKSEEDYLNDIKKNSGRYNVLPFQYNSPYSEFAPSFYKKGLIFSSDRDTGNFARYRHTWNSKDFLDLYKVNADSASNGFVTKLGDQLNTRLHESTSVVTKDGQTLYFTRNNYKEGKYVKDGNGIIRLKIFKAVMSEEGLWSNIEELPFNSDDYSIAHPTLSADEKTLYFASDMPGSFGESDIFKVAINEDGSYGTPENLGDVINTEARETFPFVTSKDILYFSSDGHPGLGGLDIFATKIDDGRFDGTVMNVGEPVNGRMDDFTFIFDEDTREGYFASNRSEGQGADDIYAFLETKPLLIDCEQAVSGVVRDKISNEPLVGASVKVIDENNEEIMSAITDAEGKYNLTVDCTQGNFVRAMTEGYIPSEEYLGKSDGAPKTIDFFLERSSISAGFGDDLAKLLQLSTIYFDFDKYNIRKDSEIEVEKVIAAMEKYSSLRIKVNSHTDSRGKDSYNLWLSQKRAEATVNYMISKGIAKERLEGEGFGETKLINKCANGVKCSDKDHELNRRSEFIILE
ncbi:OmpA family protein [Zobellia galactanivorans]|uniref:OmpA-like outer membrane protein n=1 Tax=Zobellia galactanivorans (strain DSM 12802 / CCUG 47099 / CIP 106680 / NCIMB 13871 / Dsij) TaxID=63186 RepID=G0L1I4_ZOBGA|nr:MULTISPECIES: OmpA family protein [Zobellia]MDO6809625.1 OmpA family protein [Zobellia galactanivorans]OWW23381.1 flagellar motor protein MotB [Zobellia sp. OII3]CAZ94709.1 OmpA-like outer membrane protein [Zobellia galactanivorans]